MTDNEIIKALECCTRARTRGDCEDMNCPACTKTSCYFVDAYNGEYIEDAIAVETAKASLDIINRQKAEIERLCIEIDELIIAKDLLFDEAEALIKKAKAEAIKEFAERLKYKYSIFFRYCGGFIKLEIDNLVKEMAGENND